MSGWSLNLIPYISKTSLSIQFADGKILVNSQEYKLKNFLENFNLQFGQYDKNSLVYIAADKNIKYELFMKIYSDVVKTGFTQIGLLTKWDF